MNDPHRHRTAKSDSNRDHGESSARVKSNLAMLLFGVVTLLYLVAIDHKEWFALRPASNGAIAISHASDQADRARQEAAREAP